MSERPTDTVGDMAGALRALLDEKDRLAWDLVHAQERSAEQAKRIEELEEALRQIRPLDGAPDGMSASDEAWCWHYQATLDWRRVMGRGSRVRVTLLNGKTAGRGASVAEAMRAARARWKLPVEDVHASTRREAGQQGQDAEAEEAQADEA